VYRVLVGKPEGKRPLGRPRRRWVYNNNIFIYFNWLLLVGSGYFTCKQNLKLINNKFRSGGPHEKHVVVTWNVMNFVSICL